MKNKYIYILLLAAFAFTACNEEVLDTTAPGKVTDISYTPKIGRAHV